VREQAGLTQTELAERASTSQPAVARLEAGEASPTVATLQRLAAAAGFELSLGVVPTIAPDPVTARYRADLDRTLLRRNRSLSVDQRIRELARLLEFDAELTRAGQALRRGSRR
jgi:transcriptional regulator with XRE-family HTH domain